MKPETALFNGAWDIMCPLTGGTPVASLLIQAAPTGADAQLGLERVPPGAHLARTEQRSAPVLARL